MSTDLQAVTELLDKEAIREVFACYARGVDRHDDELIARAYHADAIDDHGAYIGNIPGFIEYTNKLHAQRSEIHHHYIMNQTIDLGGDTAHVETYFLAALGTKEGLVDMVGGRYVDRLEKRSGRWAIAERVCLVEWRGSLVESKTKTDPGLFLRGTWDRTDSSYSRPLHVTRPHRSVVL